MHGAIAQKDGGHEGGRGEGIWDRFCTVPGAVRNGESGEVACDFFRRYPDKEALLNDVAAREISQLLAMTLPILYTVDHRASTQALCAYLWEHRKLWSALLTGGAAATLKDEFVRQAQQLAATQQTRHAWLPGDLSVVFAVGATIEVLAWWLKQADPPSVNEMAEILDRLIVTPSLTLAPGPGLRRG